MTLWFGIPSRVRLPSGVVWRAENDACGRAILRGRFENAERQFVERCLEPGMAVLDMVDTNGRKEWDGNFAAVAPERSEQLCKRGLMAI